MVRDRVHDWLKPKPVVTTEPDTPDGWGFHHPFEVVWIEFLDRYYGRKVFGGSEERDLLMEVDVGTLSHIVEHQRYLLNGDRD